jgi:hypothetical protein
LLEDFRHLRLSDIRWVAVPSKETCIQWPLAVFEKTWVLPGVEEVK